MKTTTPNSSAAVIAKIDMNDIIFERKNREYGAYLLRSKYSKFLTYALLLSCTAFILALSSPLILSHLKGVKTAEQGQTYDPKKIIDINVLPTKATPKDPTVQLPTNPALQTTREFRAPTVSQDDKFTYIPPELGVEIGTVTRTADPNETTGIPDFLLPTTPKVTVVPEAPPAPEPVYYGCEVMPAFPGGEESLMTYFSKAIVYPKIAQMAGIEGKVLVQCIIAKDGSIRNAQIVKSIGGGCDEEALRVVSLMQKWHPGEQNGRAVAVQMVIPIVFRLN